MPTAAEEKLKRIATRKAEYTVLTGGNESPLLKIESYAEALEWVKSVTTLHESVTVAPSQKRTWDPVISKYYSSMCKDNISETECNAIISKMLTDNLRDAAPVATQVFFLTPTMQKFFFDYFNSTEMSFTYTDYLASGTKLTDPVQATNYCEDVRKFRVALESKMEKINGEPFVPGVTRPQNKVRTTIKVGPYANDVMKIILSMNRKAGVENLREANTAPGHFEETVKILKGTSAEDDLILSYGNETRRKSEKTGGFGLKSDGTIGQIDEGYLLLSTALNYAKQQSLDIESLINKFKAVNKHRALFNIVEKEIEHMEKNNKTIWNCQKSNIDPLFMSYHFVYKVLKLGVNDFYRFQRHLYSITRVVRGRAKMMAAITKKASQGVPGFGTFLVNCSASREKHMAPFVFSLSRMEDLAACMCPMDCKVTYSISEPAMSWRYFLGLSAGDVGFISFIVKLWFMEELVKEKFPESTVNPNAIYLSEKVLQQFLTGKNGIFACTNFIPGNELTCKIVE